MEEPGIAVSAEPVALAQWLAGRGLAIVDLERLAGDVSLRSYLRGRDEATGETVMVVRYPASMLAACSRFAATTALLEAAEIRVPSVRYADCEAGVMVVEDLGRRTVFEERRTGSELHQVFRRAAEMADRLSRLPAAEVAALNPPLDGRLLRAELGKTEEAYWRPSGLLDGDPELSSELEAGLDRLCETLSAAPPLPCHRDFMVRNLVRLPGGELGVFDHQDLRLGPPFYDLASLLNDSLFPEPRLERELVLRWVGEDAAPYHRAAAQRTLKAVGTYAMFAARGSDRHLPLIPVTLERALRHLGELPETREVAGPLRRRLASRGVLPPGLC